MDRPPVAGLEENILQGLKATNPKNGQGMGRKGGRTRSVALTVALVGKTTMEVPAGERFHRTDSPTSLHCSLQKSFKNGGLDGS